MNQPEIRLNDFESFDRYLFGEGAVNWEKFYHVVGYSWIFTPPILHPVTEAEYQLDHYALWMAIARNSPFKKPIFSDDAVRPFYRCYACQYKRDKYGANKACLLYCPLINAEELNCVEPYRKWANTDDEEYATYQATCIARIPWRENI